MSSRHWKVKGLNRRSDGVLLPAAEDQPLWVIEFQAQKDPLIYHRLLIEMGLVGERHHPRPVRGLLLFLSAARDPRTPPWDALLARDREAPIRRAYLIDILERLRRDDPEHPLLAVFLPYLLNDPEQLRVQAPRSYQRLKVSNLAETTRRHCLDVFQSWLMARFKTLSLEEILAMLGELTPLEETRAYQELVAIGLQQGRQTEAYGLIVRQLRRRFGSLTSVQQEQLATLSVEHLEALGEALLDFHCPADLDAWLVRH